jgi:hypothetical protein
MEPILIDDRFDLGKFSDLMDQGFGIVTGEFLTASATSGRLAVERLVDLLRWDQGTVSLAMPVLPTAFFATGWGGGLALHPDGVRRGWLGRVGGVELEPVLEIVEPVLKSGDALLVVLDEEEDRRLKLRRCRLP